MLKKIFFKLSVVLDTIKSFIVFILIWALIIFFAAVIFHNLLKIADMSEPYYGDYKNLVTVDENKMMNVKIYGEGDKTIVILPEFGSQSPVLQYKALADNLVGEYKVAVVEYYGYGYSMGIDSERNLNNITTEIKSALQSCDISDFVVISHGLSNLYAMNLVKSYSSSILGYISIDGVFPESYNETFMYDKYLDEYHNTQLTSLLEYCGFARVLSYVKPDMFYINDMKNQGIWDDAEVKLLRDRIANSYLTSEMVKEMGKSYDNAKELADFKFPKALPVLQIFTSKYLNEYETYKNDNSLKYDANEYANNLITNEDIQLIGEIECEGGVQYKNYQGLASSILTFLGEDHDVVIEEEQEEPEEIEEPEIQEDIEENTSTQNIVEDTNREVIEVTIDKDNNVVEDETRVVINDNTNTSITTNTVKKEAPKPTINMNRISGNVVYANTVPQDIIVNN